MLLRDNGLERKQPTRVFVDNMSAFQLGMNPVHHQQSKHIDIKFHWIRVKIMKSNVTLVHTVMEDQQANFLTNTMSCHAFRRDGVSLMCTL